ncbi:MAG: hypothetical protein KDC35_20775 [Acidobacteria bacterium]|nr:hypothetical protein [Acidobacteriota bacterium]
MNIIVFGQSVNINVPNSKSEIPYVIKSPKLVRKPNASLRLSKASKKLALKDSFYGNFKPPNIDFTAWEFFHAAKKTEMTSTLTTLASERRAAAFFMEHEETFIWDTPNFRRRDRSAFALEDFAWSGFAGRVGEAVAFLAMVKKGYKYWDRCATVWEIAARQANITHEDQLKVAISVGQSGKPVLEPDFILENDEGDVAIMEAKGSFVNPNEINKNDKKELRHALDQIDAWASVISPSPSKNYAILTLLRQETDPHKDPSLVVVVDPPGRNNINLPSVELPRDLIKRCNFASWLEGMGFYRSAKALRNCEETQTEELIFRTKKVGNHTFAIRRIGYEYFEPIDFFHHRRGLIGTKPMVMGIEVETLHSISASIRNIDNMFTTEPLAFEDIEKYETGSIMSDGTFLGVIEDTERLGTIDINL